MKILYTKKVFQIKNSDNYLLILSIAVDPSYQKISIGSYLLNHLEQDVKDKRSTISLTCLKALIPFYEKNGYKNEGLSNSQHANESWYNMTKEIK